MKDFDDRIRAPRLEDSANELLHSVSDFPRADQEPLISNHKIENSDWLTGGGEIADLIRSKDWALTALGPIDTWPPSLRTTVSLCLASSFPINIIWGEGAIQIYNLAYKILRGGLHPLALGESYRVTWQSAWPVLSQPFERAREGKTTFLENQRMLLMRSGYLEETFLTFSLSPIRDEFGEVVGLFHPVTETTSAVMSQRRTRLLREITSESANSDRVSQAVQRIATTLAEYQSDIPCALIILKNEHQQFVVVANAGETENFSDLALWPLDRAMSTSQPLLIEDVLERSGEYQTSEDCEPIRKAYLLPIKLPARENTIGFLAVTLSSQLPHNESYMAFLDMLTNAVSAAIGNAIANESASSERVDFQTDIFNLQSERTSQDVAEKILIESKDAAEAATQSKSAFLANMSHEIRTPLAAILGFTEILKSPDIDSQDRNKYLNIISRNGNSLIRIIDDILDLSKIEAGKILIEQEPVDLIELIQEVIAMFTERANGKGLRLLLETSGLPNFKIQSDALRIRQILINLIGNAIKFTSEGQVLVRGRFDELSGSLYAVSICVADTGIGISAAQASNLFQAFAQADNKTTRHFGGTGLGLALSKKLAKALGGDVTIEDPSGGRGTTFVVSLVATRSLLSSEGSTANSDRPSRISAKRLAGWPILVVDDSEDNRTLMKILIEREGAKVSLASSGSEGIRKALEFQFDVVLMDIQMPDLDGYQELAKLRKENYKKPVSPTPNRLMWF